MPTFLLDKLCSPTTTRNTLFFQVEGNVNGVESYSQTPGLEEIFLFHISEKITESLHPSRPEWLKPTDSHESKC